MRKNTKPTPLPSIADKKTRIPKEERIIAVGASAGGLEALKAFFENTPDGDTSTYVVIQHLSPDYKSMMGELLKRITNLPITEVTEEIKIKRGHIYLIPPSKNLVLKEGKFRLRDKPGNQTLNLPIDMFFESLARERKEKAIGVILSGTGSDGTRGVRMIKEHGGMVMVQDPEESQFNGMPQSAINTGLVDYVLSSVKMGTEIHNFISAPAVFHFRDGDVEYDQSELMKILTFVNEKTGLDFREYKHSTLARRVARRVNVCKCNSLAEYYDYLTSKENEVEILYREFLIGVTNFFRDPEVWAKMRESVIPEIVRKKKEGDTLKIWDVACSTGEEAYTLAMCFAEEIENQNKKLELKIFATDISEKHLEIGSKGCYPESVAADVPTEFLAKYFVRKPDKYLVIERLRSSIVFSKHNVIRNPPFSNMDMVVCRNLLIYFQPAIQNKALQALHFGLKENGILLLGTSESVGSHKEDFLEINRKEKIYKNVNPNTRLTSVLSHPEISGRKIGYQKTEDTRTQRVTNNPVKKKLGDDLQESILKLFGGASILIDSNHNILQAVGEFRKYANLPSSGFSTNLLDMLDTDLKYAVLTTLKKALKQNEVVYYENAVFVHRGKQRGVDVLVKPYSTQNVKGEKDCVVTFIEKEMDLDAVLTVDSRTITTRTKEYVSNLEEELKQTKGELQNSLQEIETSNEELQAANEELLASNEELQSTNEELQSVNEEINTINAENLQKMDDLAALNADMNNLLDSTQIGTIFLDKELRIRKFTPAVQTHFNLINADVGRPISDFTENIGKSNLLERCEKVLSTGKKLEKVVVSKGGKHYLRRISPYFDSREDVRGVVITFIDVETLEKSKQQLIASEKRFKSFYEEDPVIHISVDPKTGLILHCNKMALKKLGYDTREELQGQPFLELYDEKGQIKALKLNKDFSESGMLIDQEQNLLTAEGEILPVIMNAIAERDEDENIITIRYTCVDISDFRKAEEKLKEQKADLQRANKDLEQFVSICSHDLQEPLSTIKFGSDVLEKIYSGKLDEKGKSYIKHIKESSNRLSAQIKALLEHSRIGREGKTTLVDTYELVKVVEYDLGKSIRDSGAKIVLGTMPKIKGYEVELRLLFQNLISNAIKYTPGERKPEIRISSFKEGDYWVFSVMDNGVGISEENRKNIFTIFNRIEKHVDKDGTGVGLAHVEKIVQLHEGTIWVESQEGVGSTFYFKLKV